MPQWGRPPGARLGRQPGGGVGGVGGGRVAAAQRMWDDRVVTEIDDTDYGYGPMTVVSRDRRTAVPSPAAAAAVTGEWEWYCNNNNKTNINNNNNINFIDDNNGNNNYDEIDDLGSVAGGVEYDLYDDTDRTVAYAVELALRDREDWLVERALERIRRAQGSGNNNVRLSTRELDALERRRMGGPELGNGSPKGKHSPPKGGGTSSPRGMSLATKRSPGQPTESPTRSRTRPRRSISDNDGGHHINNNIHHHHHHHHPLQSSSQKTSPQRPRTPLNQSSRSQDSNMWSRPSQLMSFLTPSRRSSQAGSPSFPRRGSNERHISRKASAGAPPHSSSPLMESDTDMDRDHDSGDDVQIVDIQQRRVPASPQPRPRMSFRNGSGSSGRRR